MPQGQQEIKQRSNTPPKTFRSLGYEVRLQDFRVWMANDGAELIVDGQSVEVAAAEYAMPCQVSGELVCVQTIEELAASI